MCDEEIHSMDGIFELAVTARNFLDNFWGPGFVDFYELVEFKQLFGNKIITFF